MNNTQLAVFGIASAVINTIGMVPYIRDIFLKKTKPERATWWIWLALSFLSLFAQIAAGATWSLGLTIGQLIALFAIAALSIPYGYGKFSRKHVLSIAIAILGIVAWQMTKEPLAALVIVVLLDFMALWLTIRKTWESPETETRSTWVLASVAGLLGVLAVNTYSLRQLIYPLYIFVADTCMTAIIMYRARAKVVKAQEEIHV